MIGGVPTRRPLRAAHTYSEVKYSLFVSWVQSKRTRKIRENVSLTANKLCRARTEPGVEEYAGGRTRRISCQVGQR